MPSVSPTRVGPVVERLDPHPLRQDAVVQLADLLVDPVEDDARVLAAAQQREPFGDFALDVVADRAEPRRVRQHDARHVADGDRRAAFALEHDRLQVLRAPDVADAADRQLLIAVLKEAAADVAVRPAERVADVGQRQVVREQTRRIDLDVHLLQVAAEGHHVGDPRNLKQDPRDGPLQLGPRLRVRVPVAHHAELVDLAERRRLGRELHVRALRQIGPGQPLVDDRPRLERVRVVVERQRDEREAEQAFAAHQDGARRAVEHAFDRHRDLPLDFLRRLAGSCAMTITCTFVTSG